MEAGLRLVEHHQGGRARGQQGGRPQQVAQGPVGEFRRAQRAQQPVLVQLQLEAAVPFRDRHAAAREGRLDGRVQRRVVAGLPDRLERGRKVGAVRGEDRRTGSDARGAGRRFGVRADVVVEPPGADQFAQGQQVGGQLRVREFAEHGVVRAQGALGAVPAAVRGTGAHGGPGTVREQGGGAQHRPGPGALAFDLGVQAEERVRDRLRVAEVHRVAELVPGEPEPQAHRFGADRRLDRVPALAHRPPRLLRAGPQGGGQPALPGQRRDGAAARGVGQQPQGPVQAGLARAVGARHHGEPAEGTMSLRRER